MPTASEHDALSWPVGVVAARLNTTTATLRAWERRYGLAPSARTRGGHRRYSAGDLLLLRRMCDLIEQGVAPADAARVLLARTPLPRPRDSAADAAAPFRSRAGADPQERVQALSAAMRALDADRITDLVTQTLADLGADAAWTSVLAPALAAIGEHWEHTGCGVEIEHVASGIIEAALRRHAQDRPPAPVQEAPILLAAVPGEAHTLPLTALAAALAERAVPTVLFGDLPAAALTDAIERLRPRAVVLWARASETADPDCLRRPANATGTPLHPAGPGWKSHRLPPDTAAALHDLRQAAELLGAHYREPADQEAHR